MAQTQVSGLIHHRGGPNQIIAYEGFSQTEIDNVPLIFRGYNIEWNGKSLLWTWAWAGIGYCSQYVGFGMTFLGSINPTPNVLWHNGVSWDHPNKYMLTVCADLGDSFHQHDGWSTTLLDSLDPTEERDPAACFWQERTNNFICVFTQNPTHMYDGWSTTSIDNVRPVNVLAGCAEDQFGDFQWLSWRGISYNWKTVKTDGFSDSIIDFLEWNDSRATWGNTWGHRYRDGSRRERQSRAHARANRRRR